LSSKLIYLLRKYSSFSTINLTAILINFGYIISSLISGENSTGNILAKSGWFFICILVASTISFLPYDIWKIRKDTKICEKLGINYNDFTILDETEKDEIRGRVSKNA